MREVLIKCDTCGNVVPPGARMPNMENARTLLYEFQGIINGEPIKTKEGKTVAGANGVEFCSPACLRKYVNEMLDRCETILEGKTDGEDPSSDAHQNTDPLVRQS